MLENRIGEVHGYLEIKKVKEEKMIEEEPEHTTTAKV